jgi:hypothetical protein
MPNEGVASDISLGSPESKAGTGPLARLRSGLEVDANLATKKHGLLECKIDRRTRKKEVK